MKLVGTGHRPGRLYRYDQESILDQLVLEKVKELRPDIIYSGMALGFDMSLASAAVGLGIPLIACIPFKGQELKWPKPVQERYNNLINSAKEVVCVSEGGYEPYKMQKRNIYLIDQLEDSDVLLMLLESTTRGSGTINAYNYAKTKMMTNGHDFNVINLWNEFKRRINEV
jgi:uncharacterized phage-like protein YoqJ